MSPTKNVVFVDIKGYEQQQHKVHLLDTVCCMHITSKDRIKNESKILNSLQLPGRRPTDVDDAPAPAC